MHVHLCMLVCMYVCLYVCMYVSVLGLGYDRTILTISIKSVQNALSDGSDKYKFCLSWPKVSEDIENKIKEQELKLSNLSNNFDPLTISPIS